MKRLLCIALFICSGFLSLHAQDIITKKDGTDIKAKVTEIGTAEIKYKSYSNLEGPIYAIPRSDVLMVTYENGNRDMIYDQNEANKSIPEGRMTLDNWTGRVSVNGMNIDKQSTYLYFTPESNALYKSGDTMSTVGDILISAGIGGAVGWLVGSLAYDGEISGSGIAYGICGGLVLIGLPLHVIGVNKVKTAIADYNSRHGFAQHSPEITIGAQNNGVGIALNF